MTNINPTRYFRNIKGSFNKFLGTSFPNTSFNFQDSEFTTGNINSWVQIDYLNRYADVKSLIIVQLTFFAKNDRYAVKAEELCDEVLNRLLVQEGRDGLQSIPVRDWFNTGNPVIGALILKPKLINKPVIDQYGITNISTTIELRFVRL